MLNRQGRAVPAEGFALHSTLETILRRAACLGRYKAPARSGTTLRSKPSERFLK